MTQEVNCHATCNTPAIYQYNVPDLPPATDPQLTLPGMREVLSEKRPIFHIFKSAEVVEAVRLGGTPT
jgi:hypothetical protein